MSNYYRITGYYSRGDCSFIADSYGKFEKLWQFSSYLVDKGIKILEVSRYEDGKDLNIGTIDEHKDEFFLRAVQKGQPNYKEREINGITHKIIDINGKCYIPNYKRTITESSR